MEHFNNLCYSFQNNLKKKFREYVNAIDTSKIVFSDIENIDEIKKRKEIFPWHLEVRVIHMINGFSNDNNISIELMMQNEIESEITKILKCYTKIQKVISFENDGYFKHHWYISSDLMKLSPKCIDELTNLYDLRPICFDIRKDIRWDNIQPYVTELKNIYT